MINFQDTQLDVFYVSSPSLVSTMTFSCSNTGVWVPPMAPKKLWHMGKWKSRGCPVERVEWWRESFEICECWDGSLWIVSGSCAEVQSAQQLRFSRVMFMKHCSSGGHSCHWGGLFSWSGASMFKWSPNEYMFLLIFVFIYQVFTEGFCLPSGRFRLCLLMPSLYFLRKENSEVTNYLSISCKRIYLSINWLTVFDWIFFTMLVIFVYLYFLHDVACREWKLDTHTVLQNPVRLPFTKMFSNPLQSLIAV